MYRAGFEPATTDVMCQCSMESLHEGCMKQNLDFRFWCTWIQYVHNVDQIKFNSNHLFVFLYVGEKKENNKQMYGTVSIFT